MRDLLAILRQALEGPRPFAYCRLVETRGSTPQKAGALMLVFEDGSQRGTLGGGCVEAEVKRRALAVLASGQAEIAKFQLDSDYGWDDGLICGGRMQVFILAIEPANANEYFQQVMQLAEQGSGFTEAVVFDQQGSGIAAPAIYLFDQAGSLRTALSAAPDGSLQKSQNFEDSPNEPPAIIGDNLRPLNSQVRSYAASGIGYLPTKPRCRLLIVGGGHVGQAVGNMAADLDFDVWVVDDRAEYVSDERFPRAARRIAGKIDDVLPNLVITPDTYCLIVTRGHNHDEEALFHLVDRGARYVGLIGSRRKIKMIFTDLLAEGISSEALVRVYAPLGIDIGSQTVPEIAVSICAELVSHRNRDGVVPGRPDPVHVADDVFS
jgi:xanthine dehydrogenase accessory factor